MNINSLAKKLNKEFDIKSIILSRKMVKFLIDEMIRCIVSGEVLNFKGFLTIKSEIREHKFYNFKKRKLIKRNPEFYPKAKLHKSLVDKVKAKPAYVSTNEL